MAIYKKTFATLLFSRWRFIERWLCFSHSSIGNDKQSWLMPGNLVGHWKKNKRADCKDRAQCTASRPS